ncbi:MAG: D-alanyl-D-alanine carboxypeptidase/D-alanyl-D-alanine-endopeptidase [bacterium]
MKIYQAIKSALTLFLLVTLGLMLCFCLPLPAETADRRRSLSSHSENNVGDDKHPLQEKITSLLDSCSAMRGIRAGIYVTSLKSGKVLADIHGEDLFIPASNQKLFTSAAALARLKPDYCFPTIIYAGKMPKDGVISGPLYIKGFGDPLLVNEELWELTRQIGDAGIKRVTEGLVYDDSYFASEENREEQQGGDPSVWYRAESGALSINFNTVTFSIRPASKVGYKPLIQWNTSARSIQVINKAITTAGSPKKALSIARNVKDGINTFTFSGQISIRHSPMTIYRAVEAPARYAAEALKEMLVQKGIHISGEVRPGIVPEEARVICQHQSKPLAIIVTSLNKISNNFIAQQLLKAMGAEVKGSPGTSDKGVAVIKEFLEEAGVGADHFTATDGCGLSKKNMTSPKKIVDLLTYMQQKFEYQPEYFASLAIAGVDGTLKKRLRNPKTQRRVRAKTGLVNGVSCLSGYVYSYQDELISFSILMNGNKNQHHLCKTIQDRIVELLLDLK